MQIRPMTTHSSASKETSSENSGSTMGSFGPTTEVLGFRNSSGCCGDFVAEFVGVLHEVAADADDLAARNDGGQQADVLQLVPDGGALHAVEERVAVDDSDLLTAGLAFNNAVEGIRIDYKPGNTHGSKPTVLPAPSPSAVGPVQGRRYSSWAATEISAARRTEGSTSA